MRRTNGFVIVLGIALVAVVGWVEFAHGKIGPAPVLPLWMPRPLWCCCSESPSFRSLLIIGGKTTEIV